MEASQTLCSAIKIMRRKYCDFPGSNFTSCDSTNQVSARARSTRYHAHKYRQKSRGMHGWPTQSVLSCPILCSACVWSAHLLPDCFCHKKAYSPPLSSSSSCEPSCTTWPPSITKILSALRMVLSLCAMMMVVCALLACSSSILCCTMRSLAASRAEVA